VAQAIRPLAEVQRVAAFRAALRHFERTTEVVVRRVGLTPRQYLLLLAVEGAPDGSRTGHIGELAEALGLAPSTISGLVDRAAAAGLVRRATADHDGRVVRVSLTRAGRDRLEQAMAGLDAERDVVARAGYSLRAHLGT
jgi:DNA-binding MarR family transcriptional regulator